MRRELETIPEQYVVIRNQNDNHEKSRKKQNELLESQNSQLKEVKHQTEAFKTFKHD